MTYKSYTEQIHEHIKFLQSYGLLVETLSIDTGFIRCREIGKAGGRGELTYKTTSQALANGLAGLGTWCRGANGKAETFQTYGLGPDGSENVQVNQKQIPQAKKATNYDDSAHKAYGFWKHSSENGSSDYLIRKGVGSYGIRFRENEYGRVAVIPMRDVNGKLWSYQLLNSDGSKRFPKGGKTEGLFHVLVPLVDGKPVGLAESYVTAATCMELTGITCVCCFSCENLKDVTANLIKKYSKSRLVIFADNDRHLIKENKGLLKAQEAQKLDEARVVLFVPDFGDLEPNKEASDWNDLVRLKGKEAALRQLRSLGLRGDLENPL